MSRKYLKNFEFMNFFDFRAFPCFSRVKIPRCLAQFTLSRMISVPGWARIPPGVRPAGGTSRRGDVPDVRLPASQPRMAGAQAAHAEGEAEEQAGDEADARLVW